MGIKDIFNKIGKGANELKGSISDYFDNSVTYKRAKPVEPVAPVEDDMYTRASRNTNQKYGVNVPPHFLRAVQQQESSGKIDESDLNLSMGFTPIAKEHLGNDYLPPTSVDNVVQNSANYLASRARGVLDNGEEFDLSTPENYSKWYVQKYVGLFPGESRLIGGQKVSYEKIVDSFEKILNQYK